MLSRLLKLVIIVFALIMAFVPAAAGQQKPDLLRESAVASTRSPVPIAARVRHRLVTLRYYDVFDCLEGEVRPDGTLYLRGQVVRPTLKSDAEASVRDVDGVTRVVNEIEVLPVSPNDDRLRVALYRAIYKFDSPLFRYATRAVPPIHILVKNGRATLKGVVANKTDSDLAYMAARSVRGVFNVMNELRVESEMAR